MIITAAVIKGGTGKTTTAAALAQAAHAKKKKVLAIDLDPQGNLTSFLGADGEHSGSYDLLHGDGADVVQETAQGIDVISASEDLAAEKTVGGSARRLEKGLAPIIGNYDYIFIDTPPQMGELTFNALQASDGLLIPLEADTSSINGLYQITDIFDQMKQRSAERLSILGVLLTRYRGNAKINQYIKNAIAEAAADVKAPYLGEIRDGIAIREAQAMRKSLFEYAPKSKPAEDYMKLFDKIKRRK